MNNALCAGKVCTEKLIHTGEIRSITKADLQIHVHQELTLVKKNLYYCVLYNTIYYIFVS